MDDKCYQDYVTFIEHGTLPDTYPSTKSNFIATSKKFTVNHKKFLQRNGKFVLKKSELNQVFSEIHQHSGRDKTYEKFRQRFWFHGMSVWVRNKVKDCVPCSNKNNKSWPAHVSPLTPIEVKPQVFWRVHIDLLGPLPISSQGNQYIALGVCSLIKYPEGKGNLFLLYNNFTKFVRCMS